MLGIYSFSAAADYQAKKNEIFAPSEKITIANWLTLNTRGNDGALLFIRGKAVGVARSIMAWRNL